MIFLGGNEASVFGPKTVFCNDPKFCQRPSKRRFVSLLGIDFLTFRFRVTVVFVKKNGRRTKKSSSTPLLRHCLPITALAQKLGFRKSSYFPSSPFCSDKRSIKNCYRQETAVRTVAQTLGGIAVFRFPNLLFEIWFCLIQAKNSSLQGDSNSLGSRNRRDPCWSLPLRSLQCKKVNERSISTWWRLCSALCLTQVCSADLTVPVLHGAIIEGVATLICRLGSRLVALKEPQ